MHTSQSYCFKSTVQFTMSYVQQSIMQAVLPSALANAALLIAAPSLGCLSTYTRAFTDLCKAYGLAEPDLSLVLDYRPELAATVRSPNTIKYPEAKLNTLDLRYLEQELSELKKETKISGFKEEFYDLPVRSSEVLDSLGRSIEGPVSESNINNASIRISHGSSNSFKFPDHELVLFDVYDPQASVPSPTTAGLSIECTSKLESSESTLMTKANDILTKKSQFQQISTTKCRDRSMMLKSVNTIRSKQKFQRPFTATCINRIRNPQLLLKAVEAVKGCQSPQKPYTCSRCERGFRLEHGLRIHRLTEVCTRVEEHLKQIIGGWICTTCGKVFVDYHEAKQHTKDNPLCAPTRRNMSCPVCRDDFTGNTCNTFVKHVEKKHKDYFDDLI